MGGKGANLADAFRLPGGPFWKGLGMHRRVSAELSPVAFCTYTLACSLCISLPASACLLSGKLLNPSVPKASLWVLLSGNPTQIYSEGEREPLRYCFPF